VVEKMSQDIREVTGQPVECPLCKILDRETLERVFVVDYDLPGGKLYERFFVVATKNKKGHAHRYMVVLDGHSENVHLDAEKGAIAEFFKFMNQFGDDFAIMEPTHATVKGHWHRVGTDLLSGAEDVKQIDQTDRIEVRFKKAQV